MGEEDGKATHYEDYDWDELPKDAQDAATALGYDKDMWDNDGKPPSDDKDWEELTNDERKAAETLGYTEENWDEGGGFCCC
ncbi:expressed unknown protein [Seminavis robusta]|uniref:Uncharacterized protein n=1 Tax=Seminavis robusta TaxID=568900 RepID=A0A9N8DXF1_9STRA|nr:expressed unknown protein [Seminavis robusta]|eukprot:Sro442_g143810.1 n/a (81) ;mRNA; r:7316-7558